MSKRTIVTLTLAGLLGSTPAEAGPFDFIRKIGDSIAHAHDRQVARQKSTKRGSRPRERSSGEKEQPEQNSQTSAPLTPAAPNSAAQTAAVQVPVRAAASLPENTGRDIPYGIPVPGREGFVTSPWAPNQGYVDVRGFPSGTEVKDPYTGKVFKTP